MTGVPRPVLRVSKVAALLDLDESQVRRLIETGQLHAHRIGKRGIRVFEDSIVRYQEAQHIVPPRVIAAEWRERKRQYSDAHLKAVESLKKAGIL